MPASMIKSLTIGRLDILLTIEQATTARNSIDEDEKTWSVYKRMFGRRKFNNSQERVEASQVVGGNDAEFVVRYDSGLTSTMRLYQGSETTYFYIRSVENLRREGYSIIRAERRDNDA